MNRSGLLVLLLIVSTALFTVGVLVERSSEQSEESERSEQAQSAAAPEEAEHADDGAAAEGSETARSEEEAHADEERLLGINLESTALIILGAAFGLLLAAVCAVGSGRRRPGVLLAVAVVLIAWAVLDIAELMRQIDASQTGIAVLAGAVAVLHLAAAAVAIRGTRDPVA